MAMIVIPNTLFLFFGALVLTCGAGLGIVIGRNLRRAPRDAEPIDDLPLERRPKGKVA